MTIACDANGAPEATWSDHAIGFLGALACIAAADALIFQRLLPGEKNQSARWFMCHAAFNVVVVMTALRDVLAVFRSPLCSLAVPMQSWFPAYFTIAGHFYHALGWKMKPHEVRHHVIFSGIGGVITLACRWGPLMGLCLFLVSGLPGACDYALLCGVKTGRVPRLREKQLNTAINTWLRIPGLVCVGAFAWCCLMHGMAERLPTAVLVFTHSSRSPRTPAARATSPPTHSLPQVVSILLSLGNGLYYGEQARRWPSFTPVSHRRRAAPTSAQVIGSYYAERALQKVQAASTNGAAPHHVASKGYDD